MSEHIITTPNVFVADQQAQRGRQVHLDDDWMTHNYQRLEVPGFKTYCRGECCCSDLAVRVIGYSLILIMAIVLSISLTYPKYSNRNDPTCDHGILINNKTCECDHMYTHSDTNVRPNMTSICDYKQKSYGLSIVLQIFFGYMGTSYFYICDYVMGSFELIFFVVMVITLIMRRVSDKCCEADCALFPVFITCAWWMASMFLFFIGYYTDEKGYLLA